MPTPDELKLHFESLSTEELRIVSSSGEYTPEAKEAAEQVLLVRGNQEEAPRASLPAEARCALHTERQATFVCTRCGAFRCQECRGDEAGLCLPCEERKGESMEGLELGWLFRRSAAVLLPSLPVVMGFGAILGVLALAQSLLIRGSPLAPSTFRAPTAGAALSVVFQLGTRAIALVGDLICIRLWAGMAEGGSPSVAEAAAKAVPRFGWAVLLQVATYVATVLAALACIVPGLFLIVAWWLALPALALGLYPLQALSRSYSLTYGHRWKLALAMGVGLAPSVALGLAWFWLSLWLPPAAPRVLIAGGSAVLSHAFAAPLYAMATLAYLRLSGARLPS
jgi:hypothetical protein